MPMSRNVSIDYKRKVISELINFAAKNGGFSHELINELSKIVAQTDIQNTTLCSEGNLKKLRRDLKLLPLKFNEKLQLFMFMYLKDKGVEESRKLKEYSERLKTFSDERLLDPQYRNALESEFSNVCDYIKSIINNIKSAMPEVEVDRFTEALNVVMKDIAWFDACLKNTLPQLFQNYVNCIQMLHFQGLRSLTDENILEYVQNYTSIPANVIQHKPVKYMILEFEGSNSEKIPMEAIELLYSLSPFMPIKKDKDYFIFIPQKGYVQGEEYPEAKIIVPSRIKLSKVSGGDIRFSWRKKGSEQPSIVFMINDKAINARQGASVYVCTLGFVPITTSAECENYGCPLRDRCFDSRSQRFRYLAQINDSYMRIYNINLSINKNAYLVQSKPFLINPIIINSGVERGVEMSIDDAWVLLSIDKAIFVPRERYRWLFIREPELPIRIKGYKLGLKLHGSKALVLRFNKNILKKIIGNVLKENEQVRNYICLKYEVFRRRKEYLYETILDVADKLLENNKCASVSDDLINYGLKVFAHTLAHVLLTLLSAKLQVEPSRTLDYYYNVENDEYVIVAVYEIGEGGLGLLERETLNSVFPRLNIVDELLNYVKIIHNKCEDRISNQISLGASHINRAIDNQELKNIWDKYVYNAYYKNNIIINAQTLRIPVWNLVSSNKVSSDDAHDFLVNVPICMDACNYCVMLEKGCSEPLYQLVTTSRFLLYHVLSELKKLIDDTQMVMNNILLSPSRDRLDLFQKLLGLATRSIKIVTYVIDDYMADRLIEIKRNRNLSVKVIIDKRRLEVIKNIKNKLTTHGIEVKALDNLHAKIYIIDDALVLEGSMNLTEKGLTENMENIELKTNPLDVYRFVEHFDEAWKNAS
jgi:hypothetical protein